MTSTKQLMWLWWGENANERDKGVWDTFKRDMQSMYDDPLFIECFSKENFDRVYQRLINEGWTTTGRFGSGMLQRIMGWTRTRTEEKNT